MSTRRAYRTVEPLFVQQIVDMYSAGKNQKEIVETTGQTYCVVRYWLKKKGVFDPSRRNHARSTFAIQGLKESNERLKQEAETRLAFSLLEKGFAYLGGYKNKKSTFQLSCFVCGNQFSINATDQRLKQHRLECPFCGEKAKAKAKVKAEKEAERIKRREEYEQQLEHWKQLREERELEKQDRLNKVRVCKECGCLFTYRSYAQSIGVDPIFVQHVDFCSKECKRKYEHKHYKGSDKHKERCDKWGLEYDPTVNLDEMINRFGLRCSICGGMCDRSDVKVRRNGARIYGNNYPSIDHIVPLALKIKGHTWDNVQVAHRGCNSRKGKKVAV